MAVHFSVQKVVRLALLLVFSLNSFTILNNGLISCIDAQEGSNEDASSDYPSSLPTGWTAPSAPEDWEVPDFSITQSPTIGPKPADTEDSSVEEGIVLDREDLILEEEVATTINGVTAIFFTILCAFCVLGAYAVYKKCISRGY